MATSKDIRPLSRFITTHDSSGQARFSTKLPEELPATMLNDGEYSFGLAYTSETFPVNLNRDEDISLYEKNLNSPPGLAIPTGTVCRIVDISPGAASTMHRTVSLDYGVVLEGEVKLILDSGETRLLKRGDVAVQRGTSHAWKNVTPDVEENGEMVRAWARMLFVLSPCQPVEVGGSRPLGEDVEGMDLGQSK
ncbi:uncharacterized protein N7459_003411 [Penicillium hispanicum]|uniref:uncharacterized protein n=1 Tax=Penicillium hispanicum TaxID=1080232 RepID=UPI0025409566|nr:uncharacterized protein N7459_003411 [Penicillium hispanicum]KAJ5587646.1 hypothetical protein N7459_003411 [Penicillium hispanicum]